MINLLNNPNINDKNLLSVILDTLPATVALCDLDWNYLYVNQTYEKWHDYKSKDLIGKNAKIILGEKGYKTVKPFVDNCLKGEKVSFEKEVNYKNAGLKYVKTYYTPNKTQTGEINGFFIITYDLTNEYQAKKKSDQLKNFYSEILNTMKEGFVVHDSHGKIIYFNQSAEKILGMNSDQLIGKSPLDPNWQSIHADFTNFPGEDHPASVTLKTGQSQLNVLMGIRINTGETKWVNINSFPFHSIYNPNNENEMPSVLATFNDITEIFHKDIMLKNIIENSPGMIYQFKISKNDEISFPFVSSKSEQIFEIERSLFENNPLAVYELINRDDYEDLLLKTKISLDQLSQFEWVGRITTPKGNHKWIEIKSFPQKEHDGGTIWSGIIYDISREKKIQEELNFERARAIHSSKLASLGEMSAGVAHEINNPLAIIYGLVSSLKHNLEDPEKFNDKVQKINNSIKRITKIINSLKRFSRINYEVQKTNNTVQSILEDSLTFFELKTKNDLVEFIVVNDSNFEIFCDKLEIEQVIINLINNAVDAVKENDERWIKLIAFDDRNVVVIRVIDSGTKINSEFSKKIFEPFFSTKEKSKGTGLGLSISTSIVEDHEGTLVLLENEINTCFEIRLPRSKF